MGNSFKFNGPGGKIAYESNMSEVKIELQNLEAKALKMTAKVIRPIIREKVPVRLGTLKKNVGSWVRKMKRDADGLKAGDVVLQVGLYNSARAKKKGIKYAYHAHLVEFGTKNMPAQPYLRPAVMDNIELIREKQAEFLKKIEKIKNPESIEDIEIDEVEDD